MFRLPDDPTREEALTFISKSASYGNLGAFIGAGFSKAVLNIKKRTIALSWGELLKKAAEELNVDYDGIKKDGISYPDIASLVCDKYSRMNGEPYSRSLSKLKHELAGLTAWYPTKDSRSKFSEYLECLSPEWIITTNYDLVIEALLTGRSITLGPNDPLSSPAGVVPVFHLHGVRTNPEEIIIAQEDYVKLFRPNEYRQIKLALTIKESTTLLLGYGLGDVNVLTALDWSKNVFKNEDVNYPNEVIQILRSNAPKKDPYRDRNGILIIEVAEISDFFEEFSPLRAVLIKEESEELERIAELSKELDAPGNEMIEQFVDDEDVRRELLRELAEFPTHLISGFVSFLDKCLDETWQRSSKPGAFDGYNDNLIILLDILTAFDTKGFPPALFQTTAYSLERVGAYVGPTMGQSWAADETWKKNKHKLTKEIVRELRNFADQHNYIYIPDLLEGL